MIMSDGLLTDTKSFRSSPKFGGWYDPEPTGWSGRHAEMTGYLWTLGLHGHQDEGSSDPDLGEGWARFGRRILHWAGTGACSVETFGSEDEAKEWCEHNYYDTEDDDA